jgi:hypothetical protein
MRVIPIITKILPFNLFCFTSLMPSIPKKTGRKIDGRNVIINISSADGIPSFHEGKDILRKNKKEPIKPNIKLKIEKIL